MGRMEIDRWAILNSIHETLSLIQCKIPILTTIRGIQEIESWTGTPSKQHKIIYFYIRKWSYNNFFLLLNIIKEIV